MNPGKIHAKIPSKEIEAGKINLKSMLHYEANVEENGKLVIHNGNLFSNFFLNFLCFMDFRIEVLSESYWKYLKSQYVKARLFFAQ